MGLHGVLKSLAIVGVVLAPVRCIILRKCRPRTNQERIENGIAVAGSKNEHEYAGLGGGEVHKEGPDN